MGALPKAKAGIGSAMNDVVREVGGTLGIAVLGSVLNSAFGSAMNDGVAGLPGSSAAADSVGAAHDVAAQRRRHGGRAPARARQPGIRRRHGHHRHHRAIAAVIGAGIALAFLPARAPADRAQEVPDALQPASA